MIDLDLDKIKAFAKRANAAIKQAVNIHAKLAGKGIDIKRITVNSFAEVVLYVRADLGPEYVCGIAGEVENALGVDLVLYEYGLKHMGEVNYYGEFNGAGIAVLGENKVCQPIKEEVLRVTRRTYGC